MDGVNNEFLPRIQRDLNILSNENNRKIKMSCITKLKSEIQNVSKLDLENSSFGILKTLQNCLSDSVESIRENAGILILE